MSAMDLLVFQDFGNPEASGYELAETLCPEPLAQQPDRLNRAWKSTNIHDAEKAIRRSIQKQSPGGFSDLRLTKKQIDGWTEVYFGFWKAIGNILNIDSQNGSSDQVGEWWSACFSNKIR